MNTFKTTTKKPKKSNVKVVALSFSNESEFSSTSYILLQKRPTDKKQYSAKAAIDAIASQLYAVYKTLKQSVRDRVCKCIKDLKVSDEILQTFTCCPMCGNKNQTSGVPEFISWLYTLHAMSLNEYYSLVDERRANTFLELGNVGDMLKLPSNSIIQLDDCADWVLVGSLIRQGIMSNPDDSECCDDYSDLKQSCMQVYDDVCRTFA